jgi:hypothetical protein
MKTIDGGWHVVTCYAEAATQDVLQAARELLAHIEDARHCSELEAIEEGWPG